MMRSPNGSHATMKAGKTAHCGTSKGCATNETKKKAPGFEWKFIDALYGGYVHWKCKYCHGKSQVVHLVLESTF